MAIIDASLNVTAITLATIAIAGISCWIAKSYDEPDNAIRYATHDAIQSLAIGNP